MPQPCEGYIVMSSWDQPYCKQFISSSISSPILTEDPQIRPIPSLETGWLGPKLSQKTIFVAFYCLDYNINYLCKQCNIAEGQDFEHQINCRLWKLREPFDHLPTNQVLEF